MVAGAWLLSPAVLGILLWAEARRRRGIGEGLGALEAKVGRLERAVATFAVEHGWLVPAVRMTIGVAVGAALLAGAELRISQRYRVTAQALAAGGTVTLFATFWAAHALWHLVPALATFGLLALVAAVAVLLAVRRDALVVAVLGLADGFATPWLLSTGEDRPIG